MSQLECPTKAPAYYTFVLHTVAAVSVPVNVLALYLVWYNSPKSSKYRFCLLYVQICMFVTEIYMSVICPGYYFFPMLGGYSTSFLTAYISGHISAVFYLFVFCFELPAYLSCFLYRNVCVADLDPSRKPRKSLMYGFLMFTHIFPFATAFCIHLAKLTDEQAYQGLKTYFPKCMHVLTIQGFAYYEFRINVWIGIIGIVAVVFLFFTSSYFIYLTSDTIIILKNLKFHMSDQSFNMHKSALISLLLQCSIPVLVIILPIYFIGVVVAKDLHEYQEMATDSMFLLGSHSLLSSSILIISNPTYRLKVVEMLKKNLVFQTITLGKFKPKHELNSTFDGQQGPFGPQGFGGQQNAPGGFGGQQPDNGRPRGPPLPFLQNVTDEARKEFFEIVSNENLTIREIESQTAQWAQTNGVSDLYNEVQSNKTAFENEKKQNISTVISNVPSVQSSLQAIFDNKDQTQSQIRETIDNLHQQYPLEVDTLMQIGRPNHFEPEEQQGGAGGERNNKKKQNKNKNKKNKKNKNSDATDSE
ncbi:unnamed protein product [Caenorhabditis bovis]|uniref:SXP/RAL-2 family protein Ani s 5-like cation-binding domain-containing protein n=1 Tax=Caenorhabditis bovis TaxID=2654633 RepID=A0A8S1F9T0_9PELO|nr:unnamed protein product [Caenorhabditis bovis]